MIQFQAQSNDQLSLGSFLSDGSEDAVKALGMNWNVICM